MATTRETLRRWLKEGKAKGATHMVVSCDTFEYEDYPVYVMPGQDVRAVVKHHSSYERMLRVMEVYSYALDLEEQLAEHRSFHYD